jgi:glyoxylase-like metal-dependent hydrolase (beta-lactamase superfamily II)
VGDDHPDRRPDREFADGDMLRAGGIELRVLHTPGRSPGSSCLYAPEQGTVFIGGTLFQGPGTMGRSFSSFDAIIESIREELLTLPRDSTAIGVEAPDLDSWLERRH